MPPESRCKSDDPTALTLCTLSLWASDVSIIALTHTHTHIHTHTHTYTYTHTHTHAHT